MFHHCIYSSHNVTTSTLFPKSRKSPIQFVTCSCLWGMMHITFFSEINGRSCKFTANCLFESRRSSIGGSRGTMAAKPIGGEAFTSNLAGMSKNQLYDIMCQMKTLIEQNQDQARQILVENPLLTRALFQAQIMLGMVQPPQVMPNIQQALSPHPQQTAQPGQQPNIQAAQPLPVPVGQQDQSSASQAQIQLRKLHLNQPAIPIPSSSVPPVTLQSQSMPSHALPTVQQAKGHLHAPVTSMTHSLSSQMHNINLPNVSSQQQQSLQTSGIPLMPLQPPLPQQPRPPSMPTYPHQLNSHMGPSLGFQHSGAPQPHLSQSTYHPGAKPRASIGSSFLFGQPPLLNQPPPQSLYQAGGSHLASDFGNQPGGSMQMDRGVSWMTGPPDNATVQAAGPPPLPGQMGHNNQFPRPSAQLSPEMEKALLQQVMSLTPDQINLLPPEQRHQRMFLCSLFAYRSSYYLLSPKNYPEVLFQYQEVEAIKTLCKGMVNCLGCCCCVLHSELMLLLNSNCRFATTFSCAG
ncbi:hypothetical protein NE237_011217 [Protea cynaroides]|uniref:Cleavage stimulation factor subunit 2 n=1 Tax=Protea cynaroides TaxID=273540 RepID=A0A9Q0GVN1_9MAGN|nr:hypothetical protein NE237_011217 [Protea cynaroides]